MSLRYGKGNHIPVATQSLCHHGYSILYVYDQDCKIMEWWVNGTGSERQELDSSDCRHSESVRVPYLPGYKTGFLSL